MAIARPTHRRLFTVFDHAYGRLARRAGTMLAGAGVKTAQATALVYIGYHNGCQLSELASGIGAGNAAVTGLVDRMEKFKLVERRKLQSDGRGKTVHLTPVGLVKREQVMEHLQALDEQLAKNFTDAEMETIYKFLNVASELEVKS